MKQEEFEFGTPEYTRRNVALFDNKISEAIKSGNFKSVEILLEDPLFYTSYNDNMSYIEDSMFICLIRLLRENSSEIVLYNIDVDWSILSKEQKEIIFEVIMQIWSKTESNKSLLYMIEICKQDMDSGGYAVLLKLKESGHGLLWIEDALSI